MATNSVLIIDPETDEGKNFIKKVTQLRDKLFTKKRNETTKNLRQLTEEEAKNNIFLLDILDSVSDHFKKLFDSMNVKGIHIGDYSRKAGWRYQPCKHPYFRIVLHFGPPEIYYIDSTDRKDYPIAVLNGEGLIIPSTSSQSTFITVYKDPIRIVYDQKVQDKVPKIRPRQYNRITLVYDFEIDESFYQNSDE